MRTDSVSGSGSSTMPSAASRMAAGLPRGISRIVTHRRSRSPAPRRTRRAASRRTRRARGPGSRPGSARLLRREEHAGLDVRAGEDVGQPVGEHREQQRRADRDAEHAAELAGEVRRGRSRRPCAGGRPSSGAASVVAMKTKPMPMPMNTMATLTSSCDESTPTWVRSAVPTSNEANDAAHMQAVADPEHERRADGRADRPSPASSA